MGLHKINFLVPDKSTLIPPSSVLDPNIFGNKQNSLGTRWTSYGHIAFLRESFGSNRLLQSPMSPVFVLKIPTPAVSPYCFHLSFLSRDT